MFLLGQCQYFFPSGVRFLSGAVAMVEICGSGVFRAIDDAAAIRDRGTLPPAE
jgi:hypothetical protein